MPRPSKAKKPSKNGQASPKPAVVDENDFLEAADEFEKSGGKWRAGDPTKAARFFKRALDVYNDGLAKFPKSFDLAYNKSRMLYDMYLNMTTKASIWDQDNIGFQYEALAAHRYALQVDNENSDLLYNIARNLVSLAGAIHQNTETDGAEPAKLFQEAVGHFLKCLSRQELEYERSRGMWHPEDHPNPVEDSSSAALDTAASSDEMEVDTAASSPQSDQWATVEEPTTPETLLDTATELLDTLSQLCELPVSVNETSLNEIGSVADPLIQSKIPSYISQLPTTLSERPDPDVPSLSVTATSAQLRAPGDVTDTNPQLAARAAAAVSIAEFTASFVSASYQLGVMPLEVYLDRIRSVYGEALSLDRSRDNVALFANVLSDFSDTVRKGHDPEGHQRAARATALEQARGLLLEITKSLSEAGSRDYLAFHNTYKDLGDVCMELHDLKSTSAEPTAESPNGTAALAKTAAIYYRGADKYADKISAKEIEDKQELWQVKHAAKSRALIADRVGGKRDAETLKAMKGGAENIMKEMQEMADEGLLVQLTTDNIARELA